MFDCDSVPTVVAVFRVWYHEPGFVEISPLCGARHTMSPASYVRSRTLSNAAAYDPVGGGNVRSARARRGRLRTPGPAAPVSDPIHDSLYASIRLVRFEDAVVSERTFGRLGASPSNNPPGLTNVRTSPVTPSINI